MMISILYGTETGNTEMLAEDVAGELSAEHEVTVCNLDSFAPHEFSSSQLYLIICSTYGDGELPASAQGFAKILTEEQTDLSAVSFAVFGLGDSEYTDTYNFGSKHIAEIMTVRGAKQIGLRVVHDASGPDLPEDIALPWAQEAVALYQSQMEDA